MEKTKKRITLWGPVLVGVAMVFWLAGVDRQYLRPYTALVGSPLAHVALYFFFTLIVLRVGGSIKRRRLELSLAALLLAVGLAWGDEIYQSQLRDHEVELDDVILDWLGIALAALIWFGPAILVTILAGKEEGSFKGRWERASTWWPQGALRAFLSMPLPDELTK